MINYEYEISDNEHLFDKIINLTASIENNILQTNLYTSFIDKDYPDNCENTILMINNTNKQLNQNAKLLDSIMNLTNNALSSEIVKSYREINKDLNTFSDTIPNQNSTFIKLNFERLSYLTGKFHSFYELNKSELKSKIEIISKKMINTIKYAGYLTFLQFIILLVYLIFIYRSIYKSFQFLMQSTNKVISGDYDFKAPDKIYNNEMGRLITLYSKMIQTLKDSHDATELRKWLRIGENELYSSITNKNSIPNYSIAVLSQICKYVSASCGAYYTYEPNEGLLYLSAAYALDDKSTKIKFRLEESLIGESVLKKEVKIIKDIPNDYIKIQSSLGSTAPRNLIIIPVYYDDQLLCAIEIAKYNDITNIEHEFLNSAQNIIANSFITNWNNEIKAKWNI